MLHLAAVAPQPLNQQEIATAFSFSKAHLAKVMQQLRRAGLVESIRGPTGGFMLTRSPAEITMLEVHAAVQRVGPANSCVLGKPRCGQSCCQFGAILERMERELTELMAKTNLVEFAKNLPEHVRRKTGC